MAEEDWQPIVCDFGTATARAGFAGEDEPRAVFPCVVGRPKRTSRMVCVRQKDYYVGDEAVANTNIGTLTLNQPVDGGVVIDWDDIEKIYHHAFYDELRIAPEEHPVLLTQSTLKGDANYQEKMVHRENRERICHIMFETFDVPAMHISLQPALALLSSGALSGFVLDSGARFSQCVPVNEGEVVTHAIHKFDLAGRDLTDHLTKILKRQGYHFPPREERKIVRDIKEKLGYVAIDYEEELEASETSIEMIKSYELPDGQVISIGAERFKCTEAFFRPLKVRKDVDGIHEVVYNSIMMCDEVIRKELFRNITVCGGSTLFPGFADRLGKEVSMLVEDNMRISIKAPPERKYSVWIGGSVLASLDIFQQMWVTKSEYDESGPSIVHNKCY